MTSRPRGWRFYLSLFTLVVLGAVGYASWRSTSQLVPPAWAPADARPYHVVRVIDGDTIVVRQRSSQDTYRLRYLGLDAPEVGSSDREPEAFSEEARDINREWVEDAVVWVAGDEEERDQHGRLLGYVFSNGRFINEDLVAEGYAEVMLIAPNLRYADSLVAAQTAAREEGRGMWSRVEPVGDPAAVHRHVGSVVRLRGEVRAASVGDEERPGVLVLRVLPIGDGASFQGLGSDPGLDSGRLETVTVWLFPEFRTYFPPAVEERLRGQMVDVIGRLQRRDGRLHVVIREPGQLRVVLDAGSAVSGSPRSVYAST